MTTTSTVPPPNELSPLVPGLIGEGGFRVNNNEGNQSLRRGHRRWWKYGGIAAIVVVAAVALGLDSTVFRNSSSNETLQKMNPAVQADYLFAGLLVDEKGFYFPMASIPYPTEGAHRFLRRLQAAAPAAAAAVPPTVDWSFDWKTKARDGAAIGEYYKAKGLVMADYYRSKFDPTYKTAAKPPTDDAAPWTYDWKADRDRGIAIGQHYKAIGDAITDHYRRAYDPTYPRPEEDEGRRLKSKEKKKKEMAGYPATGWYDWQADRDRGIAIGMHYKQLGEQMGDHYNKMFNPMYDVNKKTYTEQDWPNAWKDYKARGQEIADYYKSKAAAIDNYYAGKYNPWDATMNASNHDPLKVNVATASVAGVTHPDAAYIWGLDWQKDRDRALAIHKDMMNKGIAVGEYYRARYDPTYGVTTVAPPSEGKEAESDNINTAHNPDVDFPPWGHDSLADKQHGLAIGQYWKDVGAAYKIRGMQLGKYYKDMYRSQFDPLGI